MTVTRGRAVALLLALGAAAGVSLGLIAHAAFGETERISPALPAFHGQVTWAPGERAAPPFRLRDQDGAVVSLAGLRDRPVLLTFFDSRCHHPCHLAGLQLGTMLRQMEPADRPTLVIVSVDPSVDTPVRIRHAMTAWGLAGPWRSHWLRGRRRELAPVWAAYGIRPTALALYLLDRQGFLRTGYLFPFLPNFVALDLRKLAAEQA
jgi:cytochrome oxidase Cu insertion factor (SCO1/SenC/PrrC family)